MNVTGKEKTDSLLVIYSLWFANHEWYLDSSPSRPYAPRPSNRPSVPHSLLLGYRCPVPLPQFQMAPTLNFLISSGSKKKEPRRTEANKISTFQGVFERHRKCKSLHLWENGWALGIVLVWTHLVHFPSENCKSLWPRSMWCMGE
jgi:hypothetical protein